MSNINKVHLGRKRQTAINTKSNQATKLYKPSNLSYHSLHYDPKSSLPLHLLLWLFSRNSLSSAAFWLEAFSVAVPELTGTVAATIQTCLSSYFQKIFGEKFMCLSDIFVGNRQSCRTQSSLTPSSSKRGKQCKTRLQGDCHLVIMRKVQSLPLISSPSQGS